MSKFVRVKEVPETLKDYEYVVSAPTFLPEISACKGKKPKGNTMTTNYLREIVATIGLKYADETFNALTDVNISRYIGVPCETEGKINDVVTQLFTKQYPKMLDLFVEYHLKQRPAGTRVVYFLGGTSQVGAFLRNGLDEILEKELESYLGLKPKKTVGKPAITNQEAQSQKETVV